MHSDGLGKAGIAGVCWFVEYMSLCVEYGHLGIIAWMAF